MRIILAAAIGTFVKEADPSSLTGHPSHIAALNGSRTRSAGSAGGSIVFQTGLENNIGVRFRYPR
jgi:hypothetical protein